MEFLIRKAKATDMSKVLDLIVELAIFEKEPSAVEISVDDLIRYGIGSSSDFDCFVAEADNDIVGIALVYTRFSTWKGRVLHLEDLIVSKDFERARTETISPTFKAYEGMFTLSPFTVMCL